MRQGIFLPESTFSADSLTCVRTPPCAIACINICAHVRDPVVYARVRWIWETLTHPACTLGWVARLCRSWLSLGKSNPNFPWEKSQWDDKFQKQILKNEVDRTGRADIRKAERIPRSRRSTQSYHSNPLPDEKKVPLTVVDLSLIHI